tara:strand:+ start:5941 stop:6588 length:648 start_codon:yes stop_codon:yes gene_type:complete
MKIIAIIPIKNNSQRVHKKNFKMINGKPLYRYLLDNLSRCNFDEIYVDSDSKEIENYCKKKNYSFIKRIPNLSKDSANGNDLLNYHSTIIKADIYFQLFITSPLLKISTINKCISILKKNKKYDSIFTIKKIHSWFWFKNKPVNYKPKILPRSQDAKPIIQETTGIYGIRKNTIKKVKCRIGSRPYLLEVGDEESIDLDNKKDFEYLKFVLKKNK